ncbi:hypothetical protein [Phocaeicola vulgatus]|uniref:hypothetical protein n=1 Tax=Phocaeicola vulgatus TaxID=821 RepID=UPI0021662F6C|nr:hypothetical protein [Phocaeicola vulgatus]MCS2730298.1 hypothetical protein [Phocaeicola vulgatus]
MVDKANAEKVDKDPNLLGLLQQQWYSGNNVDYKMYISAEVAYKWGVLKKEALEGNGASRRRTPFTK